MVGHRALAVYVRPMPPRILWANVACLLDTSSGAAMSARQMLKQLHAAAWDVRILGATTFDHPRGATSFAKVESVMRAATGGFVAIDDDGLRHRLLVTGSDQRAAMTNAEEGLWFDAYVQALEQFQPDIIFYFGGQPFDELIAHEAKAQGIATTFYLVNGNYRSRRWLRHIDLFITDSQATADLYAERFGIDVVPVDKFIVPANVVAAKHSRDHVLFVNPTPAKGGHIVAAIAANLEQRRPDIRFEIVESRGGWADIMAAVGRRDRPLGNVTVTPHSGDMRPAYGRARVILAPSLWWESGGRVLVEAMLNGIPAIITDRGGPPEVIRDGGHKLQLPDRFFAEPFAALPTDAEVAPLAALVERYFDDAAMYAQVQCAAARVGQEMHDIDQSTARLIAALESLLPPAPGA